MTKNPFELRYELLAFARDTLTSEYHAKLEEAKVLGSATPKYPTNDDVFKLAEEYKNFIERK